MKISFAVKHSWRISCSVNCTCFPGLPFLTSNSRSIISSRIASSCRTCDRERVLNSRYQTTGIYCWFPMQSTLQPTHHCLFTRALEAAKALWGSTKLLQPARLAHASRDLFCPHALRSDKLQIGVKMVERSNCNCQGLCESVQVQACVVLLRYGRVFA